MNPSLTTLALVAVGAVISHWTIGRLKWAGVTLPAHSRHLNASAVPSANMKAVAPVADQYAPNSADRRASGLTSLQRMEAFGPQAASFGIMEARNQINGRFRGAVRKCMFRSVARSDASLRFTIETRMVDREVNAFVRPPQLRFGELSDEDLLCLVREVSGPQDFRQSLTVGDEPLRGERTISVRFRSLGDSPPGSCSATLPDLAPAQEIN